ncbi:MAG: dihydrofolate reductase family protein [Burkholderiaceae bacterium]|nr:dihydrofolate reductase family protein [Burkholderiaceae bacterium]
MRQMILQMQMSVDGYLGRKGEGPEWQVWDWGKDCTWDEELIRRFNSFFEDVDCIVLGRNIIEGGYLDHWTEMAALYPRQPEFAFALKILDVRKIVISRTLTTSKWPRTEIAKLPLAEEMSRLKAETGGTIVAFGGVGLAASLIEAHVVDEIQFYVNPVALGDGLTIFKETDVDTKLELLGTQAYDCGIAVNRYERA